MLKLALAHIIARPKQTLLTLAGIILGSTAFVGISGFFIGLQIFMVDSLVNNGGHLNITSEEKYIEKNTIEKDLYDNKKIIYWIKQPSGRKDRKFLDNPSFWYKYLKLEPSVIAFSPQLNTQVLVKQDNLNISMLLNGIRPKLQERVTTIGDHMILGSLSDLDLGSNRIILGSNLAQRLGSQIHDSIQITSADGKVLPFKVVGTFQTGIKDIDNTQAYSSLNSVQNLENSPGRIGKISVRFIDPDSARKKATVWRKLSVDKIESWDEASANILSIFDIQNALRYFTVFVILIVAGFGTYNTLNVIVSQKKKDIAILRSMGFQSRDILWLFLFQGLSLGFAGGLVGLFFGYLLCLGLQAVPFAGGPMESSSGFLTISFDVYIYIYAMILSLFSSSIASILPAFTASRLSPIEIIRGEL